MSMSSQEQTARLTLRALPGLTDRAIHRLLREHGSAEAALRESAQLLHVGAKTLPDDAVRARVTNAQRLIDQLGIHVLTPDAATYPRRMHRRLKGHAPAMLFAIGDLSLLQEIGVAIVGSRAMSEYGRSVADLFARDLAIEGVCIISGLAHGIDAVAHAATLDVGGDTIAVVGNGVDIAYPAANSRLRARICSDGLVLSQFLPGTRPSKQNFPERNLVLAALSEGVVVAEAGPRSGANITAHHAGDIGIDAMAVPGPIGVVSSVGSNQLIREGLVCVTSAAEVLQTIDRTDREADLANQRARAEERRYARLTRRGDSLATEALLTEVAERARAALNNGPLPVDIVAAMLQMSAAEALVALMELELAGVALQRPGGRFALKHTSSAQ